MKVIHAIWTYHMHVPINHQKKKNRSLFKLKSTYCLVSQKFLSWSRRSAICAQFWYYKDKAFSIGFLPRMSSYLKKPSISQDDDRRSQYILSGFTFCAIQLSMHLQWYLIFCYFSSNYILPSAQIRNLLAFPLKPVGGITTDLWRSS